MRMKVRSTGQVGSFVAVVQRTVFNTHWENIVLETATGDTIEAFAGNVKAINEKGKPLPRLEQPQTLRLMWDVPQDWQAELLEKHMGKATEISPYRP